MKTKTEVSKKGTYLSVSGEGDGMVGAAGYLHHLLAEEVGGDQGRYQAMVGGPVAQLAVAIVAPGKHLPICRRGERSLIYHVGIGAEVKCSIRLCITLR